MLEGKTLPVGQLSAWMQLNGIITNGVKLGTASYGSAIIATKDLPSQDSEILMTVPAELILTVENVWIYGKADQQLLAVLEAMGEYGRTARGAILIFLLMQLTHNATGGKVGVATPFSMYLKFMPEEVNIPTFWTDDEMALFMGTSLEPAHKAKMKSLQREFDQLREATSGLSWCAEYWWAGAEGSPLITIDDWKYVDAVYRSRALELPGAGNAMVPCIDMANHASGSGTGASYKTDADGNAILVLEESAKLRTDEEVTITYGDTKGACEMVFSYGFLEEGMKSANELFLSLDIPDDDPLKSAKQFVAKTPPGMKLVLSGDTVSYEGAFVWLLCINEEDGLQFLVSQTVDGTKELQMTWQGTTVSKLEDLMIALEKDEASRDIYRLRATIVRQTRVEDQLIALQDSQDRVQHIQETADPRADVETCAIELRDLEDTLLLQAYEELEAEKVKLLESPIVQQYLNTVAEPGLQTISDTTADDNDNKSDQDKFS